MQSNAQKREGMFQFLIGRLETLSPVERFRRHEFQFLIGRLET